MQFSDRDDEPGQGGSEPEDLHEFDPETELGEDGAIPESGSDALPPAVEPESTDPSVASYAVDRDNSLVGFVESFNARDWEGVSDLLAEDVTSDFFQATTAEDLIEGMIDLMLRYPTLVVTRGDLGHDPVAAAWLLDQDLERYGLVGYFRIEVDESDEPLIANLEYIEEVPDTPNAVFEAPEGTEIDEWEDWSLAESGE